MKSLHSSVRLGVWLTAMVLLGCSRTSEPPFGPEEPRLGRELTGESVWVAAPVWSVDGREIYFVRNGPSAEIREELAAVDVRSGSVRVLAGLGLGSGGLGWDVDASADGRHVYVTVSGGGFYFNHDLYRVPVAGGSLELVARSLAVAPFEVSDDDERVVFLRQEGAALSPLVVLDNPGAPEASPRPVIHPLDLLFPLSLSPDGKQLVFMLLGSILLLSLDERELRTFPMGPSSIDVEDNVLWLAGAPHVLEGVALPTGVQLFDVNGLTNVSTAVGPVLEGQRAPSAIARSADGAKIAAWVPIATSPDPCPYDICGPQEHWRLYLLDSTGTDPAEVLAEIVTTGGLYSLMFAPDGKALAYTFGSRLFVHLLS